MEKSTSGLRGHIETPGFVVSDSQAEATRQNKETIRKTLSSLSNSKSSRSHRSLD